MADTLTPAVGGLQKSASACQRGVKCTPLKGAHNKVCVDDEGEMTTIHLQNRIDVSEDNTSRREAEVHRKLLYK